LAQLISRLSLPEAVGLSLAVISPTVTAAFNITLLVQAAGPAAPLTFAIGMVAMALVALSFMAFTRRVPHAGSAYAYVAHTFGRRMGFVAGWTLLLTYIGFSTGFAALVGSFTSAALKGFGIDVGGLWLVIGAASMIIAWWLAYRDMRLSGRLMLILEAIALIGIVTLCVLILRQVRPSVEQTLTAFRPSKDFGGWSGLGFGMVFSILCFAGFEGAATLGEETVNPRRNIPIALLGTVIFSGIFFAFVAYCEVLGYGLSSLGDLAKSQAPLDDLAVRYASTRLAIGLDLAAAISCFSGLLGGIAASGRVLFALGRAGLSSRLAHVHPTHGTPAVALSWVSILVIAPFLCWAPFGKAGDYYSYTSTIAVLALILVYIGVCGAEFIEARRDERLMWSLVCIVSSALLLWVLYRNLYPVPAYPNNLWPYFALAWVAISWLVMNLRPAVKGASPS
jgi:amino acid transporter